MTIKNTHKTLQKKTQSLKRSMANFVPLCTIVKNKRAVSAVVSNLILIAAVLAIGMVALGYARSASINYQTDYSKTMNSDINKIKESLTFEYAHYSTSTNQLTFTSLIPDPSMSPLKVFYQ
jgi:predicted PurR-regulated permease PerM